MALISSELLLKKALTLFELNHLVFYEILDYREKYKEQIHQESLGILDEKLKELFPTGIDEIDPKIPDTTFRKGIYCGN